MEYKLFDKPRSCSPEFYAERAAVDHIQQPGGGSLRLYLAAGYAAHLIANEPEIETVGDFGCGTGGMLALLGGIMETVQPGRELTFYGYDLCPANVEMARARGVDAELVDFPHVRDAVVWPDLLIMTEVIEHLESPHDFLWQIPKGTRILFTVPAVHDGFRHDKTHLWSWTETSFPDLCESRGIKVTRWERFKKIHQVVIGTKRR